MPTDFHPELEEGAVDPAPHLVTDEELQRLIEHDHEERALDRAGSRRLLTAAALGGVALAVIAIVVAVFALIARNPSPTKTIIESAPVVHDHGTDGAAAPATDAAPTLAEAKGIKFEKFRPVDATLPAVPAGAVKHFTVGVMEHMTQVSPDLAPVKAWTYTVNGVAYRGTAGSPPIVVNQGDHVSIRFAERGTHALKGIPDEWRLLAVDPGP